MSHQFSMLPLAETATSSRLFVFLAVAVLSFSFGAYSQEGEASPLAGVSERLERGQFPEIEGVVTTEIVQGYLFLQDSSGALCLRLQDSHPFVPGDVIRARVTGYDGRDFWYIADTAVLVGRKPLPSPLPVDGREFSVARHHGMYVTAGGIVTGYSRTTYSYLINGSYVPVSYEVLTVECDGFPVRLCFDAGTRLLQQCPTGSRIRFTGAARVHDLRDRPINPYVAVWLDDPDLAFVEELPPFLQRVEVRRTLLRVGYGVLAFLVLVGGGVFFHRRHMRRLRLQYEELECRVAERTEELREALERERKLGLVKDDFVSLVSHEFRTPLGVIMSAAEVLRRYFDRLDPVKRDRHLEMICNSTSNLAAMIEEVLLLGRMEDGKVSYTAKPLELDRLSHQIAGEVNATMRGKATVVVECGENLEGALGDESLLRHIFSNLLSNACKYSDSDQLVFFRVSREGGDAKFVIEDRGIGIPEADQGKLFSSFSRGSNVGMLPGTGLGLVIVKRCVDLHGGSLSLESTPGAGTVATVLLPLYRRSTLEKGCRIGQVEEKK